MMCSKDYIELAENSILHTYNRFPVVLDKGKGVYLSMIWREKSIWILEQGLLFFLWDTEMKKKRIQRGAKGTD